MKISLKQIKKTINGIFKKIYHKITDFFYYRIDTERFYKSIRHLRKYYRKMIVPTLSVSIFLSVVYVLLSMRFFKTFYPIAILFIFVLVFIILSVRGCLKGEGDINEYSQDN